MLDANARCHRINRYFAKSSTSSVLSAKAYDIMNMYNYYIIKTFIVKGWMGKLKLINAVFNTKYKK